MSIPAPWSERDSAALRIARLEAVALASTVSHTFSAMQMGMERGGGARRDFQQTTGCVFGTIFE